MRNSLQLCHPLFIESVRVLQLSFFLTFCVYALLIIVTCTVNKDE